MPTTILETRERIQVRQQDGGFTKRYACFIFSYPRDGVISIGLRVDRCFPVCFSVAFFSESFLLYMQCGCDDHLVLCTTQSSLMDPLYSSVSPYNGYIYIPTMVRTMAQRNEWYHQLHVMHMEVTRTRAAPRPRIFNSVQGLS